MIKVISKFPLFLILGSAGLLPFPASAQLPIMIYHAHSNLDYDEDSFREQMDFLEKNDFSTITPDQFLAWRLHDEPLPLRPVLLTVDDNYIRVYTSMFPILDQRNQVITNFTITDAVGRNQGLHYCDWEELREMESSGAVISESHTRGHPHLTELSSANEWDELAGSKAALEDNIPGKASRYIAYPYGDHDEETIEQCITAGYAAGFSTETGWNTRETELFKLRRLNGDGIPLSAFQERIGFNALPSPPPGEGWVIDDSSVHFTVEEEAWLYESRTAAIKDSHYARGPGSGAHEARWALRLPTTGRYRLHAWWEASEQNASNASYRIEQGGEESTVTLNQQRSGGQWNSMGEYYFNVESPVKVFLSDAADGKVIADAIWFELLEEGPATGWALY